MGVRNRKGRGMEDDVLSTYAGWLVECPANPSRKLHARETWSIDIGDDLRGGKFVFVDHYRVGHVSPIDVGLLTADEARHLGEVLIAAADAAQ